MPDFISRFGDEVRWYVPMGLKKWLHGCGCNNVVELTWWQTDMFHEDLNISVACTPCQHWGKRTAKDENKVGKNVIYVIYICFCLGQSVFVS